MKINDYKDVISACRYCFMCRHLSAVGNVSYRESDTPRGRALIADTVRMHPEEIGNADFVETIYRADLSGANRCHCVSHYDEVGLMLALREDIVNANAAPEAVKKLAAELAKSAEWRISGSAKTALFFDPATQERPSSVKALRKIAEKAGIDCSEITGGCIGKALGVLGFAAESVATMKKFTAFVNESQIQELVVASPAAFHALTVDFPAAGCKLKAKVVFAARWIAELIDANKLKVGKAPANGCLLAGDYLKNYLACSCAETLLAKLGAKLEQFGANSEESYTAGEGALVLERLYPELGAKLAAKVAAEAPGQMVLYVTSAHSAALLAKAGCTVKTLEEAAAEAL